MNKNAANFIRCIALDIIDKANSGHQGIVLGMADVMTVLWSKHLKFKKNHDCRDRFVLSAGHGSALLYSTLYCINEIEKEDLNTFRQIHSDLPGHPEKSDIIEMTTGPLGQGIAWAVGMAKAETFTNKNYYTYVVASDGDLMEGISHEACSLAGKWNLNKLIVFWDDNEITIDGSTHLSREDQIPLTFKSYNWDIIEINGNNIEEIDDAINKAKNNKKPTLIRCKTIIGYGSNYENDERIHGKILNSKDVEDLKNKFNINYDNYEVPLEIKKFWDKVIKNNESYFANKENQISENKTYGYDENIYQKLQKDMPTREASGIILEHLSEKYDDIIFGSADLGLSTNTKVSEKYISFGVREHGMTAISGGMTLSGFKACCATFLAFTDYARPALRLAALMRVPMIFIATHDSIALGEDGPTHQPIEHLESLRLIPNLNVFRPSNGLETLWSWIAALNSDFPSVLVLSRQKIKNINVDYKNIKPAYMIQGENNAKITIIATGSEVPLACEIADELNDLKQSSKVISMISTDLFEKESSKYKSEIFSSEYIICIEASNSNIWYKYAFGKKLLVINIEEFGLSGKGKDIMDHFGFTKEKILAKI